MGGVGIGCDLPRSARNPLATHTTRLRPTDPVLSRTLFGEMKIPDPKDAKRRLQFLIILTLIFIHIFIKLLYLYLNWRFRTILLIQCLEFGTPHVLFCMHNHTPQLNFAKTFHPRRKTTPPLFSVILHGSAPRADQSCTFIQTWLWIPFAVYL